MSEENKEAIEQPEREPELPVVENEQSEGESKVESPEEKPEEPAKEADINELPLPGDEEAEKDHEKTWPKGFKARLQRKEKHLQQTAAENARLKAERQQLLAAVQQNNRDADNIKAPKRDDYATEEEYFDARYQYKHEKDRIEEQQTALRAREIQQFEAVKKLQDEIDSKGITKYEDYDEVTEALFQSDFPANRGMYEAILDSDHAPDIFYFLGKYRDEAKKIAVLHPVKAIKKIAELEARFKARKNASSKAPRPVETVKSRPVTAAGTNPQNLSPSEYRAWREAQKNK